MNTETVPRKIVLIFLLMIMLSSDMLPVLGETIKSPVKSEITLISYGSPPEEPEKTRVEYVFVNEDINKTTLSNVSIEIQLAYNVTFKIIRIDKGTFDNATIVSNDTVRFNATEIKYGEERHGRVIVSLSSPMKVKIGPIKTKIKLDKIEIPIEIPQFEIDLQKVWVRIKATWESIKKFFTKFFGIPEFPLGTLVPLTIGVLVLFLYRRRARALEKPSPGIVYRGGSRTVRSKYFCRTADSLRMLSG